jgi:F-type H+-transporting ATPase subunit epsilon
MAAPETSTAAGSLQVVVISPERTIFEGMADSVIAPAFDGELGILRGHAPLMALLGSGDLRVRHAGKVEHFHVEGGFLQVVDDVVTVLSERAEIAA